MALNGEGEPPEEWLISRTCEEFGVLPSAAIEELENDADHLISTILTMRAFAHTKAVSDSAKSLKDRPTGYLADLVTEFEFAPLRRDQEGSE